MNYLTAPGSHFTVFQRFVWDSLCGPTSDLSEFVISTSTSDIYWPPGLDVVVIKMGVKEVKLSYEDGLLIVKESTSQTQIAMAAMTFRWVVHLEQFLGIDFFLFTPFKKPEW